MTSTTASKPRFGRLVGLLLASAALTACGSPLDESQPAAVLLPDPLPTISASSVMPYDAYTLTAAERNQLNAAFNHLVIGCARQHGVELKLVTESRAALGEGYELWAGRFGTLTLDQARRHGYHAVPDGPVTTPFTVFVREDEEPQQSVLNGDAAGGSADRPIPTGGCRGETMRRLGGDPRRIGPPDAEALRLQALRDSRTAAAIEEWSQCMRSDGYRFETVDGPVDSVIGQRLSAAEKALAVADVTCTRSSRWSDIAYSLQSELQQRSISVDDKALSSKLTDDRQMLRTALRLAEQDPGATR